MNNNLTTDAPEKDALDSGIDSKASAPTSSRATLANTLGFGGGVLLMFSTTLPLLQVEGYGFALNQQILNSLHAFTLVCAVAVLALSLWARLRSRRTRVPGVLLMSVGSILAMYVAGLTAAGKYTNPNASSYSTDNATWSLGSGATVEFIAALAIIAAGLTYTLEFVGRANR